MLPINIKLNTLEAVKKFINVVDKYNYQMDLVSGRYIVDAKSIMAVLGLDLSNTIELTVHCDKENVIKDFKKDLLKINILDE